MDGLSVVEKNRDNNHYSFTDDQKIAIDNILDFIAAPFNSAKYIVGLTGAGGTGKTFVTNYIINKCKYATSVIKCAAPTHKACRVFSNAIGGKEVETIQSIFGLRLDLRLEDFNPAKPQFNPMAKAKLDNVKLLIVDESSMPPAKLITFICNKCKELEIKVIFIGDPFQLTPVNERKSIAFDRCFAVYNLTQLVRQAEGNPIIPLLNLLRKDIENKTYGFIEYITKHIGRSSYNENGEGFSIVRAGQFRDVIDRSFHNEDYTKNIDMYRIIGYTNNNVSSWNNYIRNSIIKDADKHIITKNDLIMSYETIVNEFMEIIINNSEEYIIHDIVNYVDTTYGFNGFLVRFQLVHGGAITKPIFVINHRDQFSILKYHKVITELITLAKNATGGTRVAKWKSYYDFKKKYLIASNVVDRMGTIIYKRDIDYGFSITAHKSQGSTYGSVFVDVNNMVYDKNNRIYSNQDDLLRRLYVGASRAKKELILSYGV